MLKVVVASFDGVIAEVNHLKNIAPDKRAEALPRLVKIERAAHMPARYKLRPYLYRTLIGHRFAVRHTTRYLRHPFVITAWDMLPLFSKSCSKNGD